MPVHLFSLRRQVKFWISLAMVSGFALTFDIVQLVRILQFKERDQSISSASGTLYLSQVMGGRHGSILTLNSSGPGIAFSCATPGIALNTTCLNGADARFAMATVTWIDVPSGFIDGVAHHPLSIDIDGVNKYTESPDDIRAKGLRRLRVEFIAYLLLFIPSLYSIVRLALRSKNRASIQ
jgi:hypothetical protein